jgi:quercetin dioxygenase-like cupin family protein
VNHVNFIMIHVTLNQKMIFTFTKSGDIMKNNKKGNKDAELEKSVSHIIIEIIEYVPNAVVSKTIIKKSTGNITAMSFAEGEELSLKTSPFDTFIQIIDGSAELVMDKKIHNLKLGVGIIIPAQVPHCFNANEQFKMISTVIKNAYEE